MISQVITDADNELYLSVSSELLNELARPPLCMMVLPLKSSRKCNGSLP